MITKVLHTGFMVDELQGAIDFYKKLGFSVIKQFDKPDPKAKAAHLEHADGSVIELWDFADPTHPQVEFIKQHIAVESDDLQADIKAMVEAGGELVIPITQGVILKYAFIREVSGNCIEIATAKTEEG